jgi:hypothetical protein
MASERHLASVFGAGLMACALFGSVLNSSAQTSQGATDFSATNSSQVVEVQQAGTGFGLKATTSSTGPVGAVFGQATGTSGYNNGVWGRTYSSAGVAIRGEAMANTGDPTGVAGFSDFSRSGIGMYGHANYNGIGILGQIDSQDFTGIGVYGRAGGSCCGIPGVFEQDAAVTGGYPIILVGQYMDGNQQIQRAFTVTSSIVTGPTFWASGDSSGDDLYVGRTPNNSGDVFRVDPTGAVYADGGYHTGGADFAETFEVQGPTTSYSAGDVMVIDRSATRRLTQSSRAYSTLVAGIYSTKPGVLASPYKMDQAHKPDIPLAVVGVVPCKVTTENGAIQPGDLLVTAAKPGFAMKGTDRSQMIEAVLGKALESLLTGDGVIQVLVSLQ